jgi:type III secretion protein L
VVEAKQEARRIIDEAEQQANRIRDEAEQEREQLRQQGYDEGYQEGVGQYTEQTTKALLDIDTLKVALEPEYIRLVTACVEKIVGEELKLHPESIIGIVRNSLKAATQQREINVRVNPADAEILRKNQRRLLDVLARANSIEIREDDSVGRGGCIVVTELGTIDASLERQLNAIQAALDEEFEHGDPAAPVSDDAAGYEDEGDEDDYEDYG